MKKLFYVLAVVLPTIFVSCSSDNDEDKGPSVSNSYTIVYDGSVKFNDAENLKIENEFIALVKENSIKGMHVGETTADYKGKKIKISVTPKYTYVDLPITKWGASNSTIKSLHKVGTLDTSNTTNLWYDVYEGGSVKYMYTYLFKNGQLYGCALTCPASESSSMIDWLMQSYIMVPSTDSDYIAIGMNGLTGGTADTYVSMLYKSLSSNVKRLYTNNWIQILFIPILNSTSAKTRVLDLDLSQRQTIIEELQQEAEIVLANKII